MADVAHAAAGLAIGCPPDVDRAATRARMRKGRGWYATFAVLLVVSFAAIYALTGMDALGAAARFVWNALVLVANGLLRAMGSLVQLLARGVGLRRLSRIAGAATGVGLGYVASVVVSDVAVSRARGWRGKAQAGVQVAREKWHDLPLLAKLLAVVALIISQVYLHVALIVFPIAFLVPVVRRLWVGAADVLFGKWYWKTFGRAHRAAAAMMRSLPGVRSVMQGFGVARLRYLCAWRLWRYDPLYRDLADGGRHISIIEPVRLWWQGELDGYVGRPLLAGRRAPVGQT